MRTYALPSQKSSFTPFDETRGVALAGNGSPACVGRFQASTGQQDTTRTTTRRDGRQGSRSSDLNKSDFSRIVSRYKVAKTQRAITTYRSVKVCGTRVGHRTNAAIEKLESGRVRFTGLNWCGCGSVCLTCAERRAREHADRIDHILAEAEKEGLAVLFLTSTLNSRNNAGQFGEFWDNLQKVWRSTFTPAFKGRHGVVGIVKAADWTLSRRRTLHAHLHSLLLIDPLKGWDLAGFKKELFSRWDRFAFKRTGLRALEAGQDLQQISGAGVSTYLVKAFEALEVSSTTKRSATWSWSLRELLEEIALTGDKSLIRSYQQIELALKGKRRIGYSGKAKDWRRDDAAEKEDADPVAQRTIIPDPIWDAFSSRQPKLHFAFKLGGIAEEYFINLCELVSVDGCFLDREEIEEHIRVFDKALDYDFDKILDFPLRL